MDRKDSTDPARMKTPTMARRPVFDEPIFFSLRALRRATMSCFESTALSFGRFTVVIANTSGSRCCGV
jgi:hypothetical protein